MNTPFFGNYWNSPRSRMAEIPINNNKQMRSPFMKEPKIVSIPVHFVGSEKTRSKSALKIQKVFRGFLVRKSMKKITQIRKEVESIEKRISQKEIIDLIRRDSKEKLKVNEMLMALLLRLDSIRGFDSTVRECRKSVTKKAIMLQEKVDSIVAEDETLKLENDEENKHQVSEVSDSVVLDSLDNNEIEVGVVEERKENEDPVVSSEKCENPDQDLDDPMVESPEKFYLTHDYEPNSVKSEENEEEKGREMEIQESEPELIQVNKIEDTEMVEEEKKKKDESRDLMAKMVEGNEKLTKLVTELCDRNDLQTRMITSLTKRVENLEKALCNERSKNKKKKILDNSSTIDGGRFGRK